jgi:hypothetical protein
MTTRIVLEAGVETEIEKATLWYEQQRPGLALQLAQEVRKVLEELLRVPNKTLVAPGIAPELGVRRVLLPVFPYAVVILERKGTIHVLAFAHLKKKPNYWHGRLRKVLKSP